MSYLLLATLIHENGFRAYAILGVMMLAISMCVAGVGL